MLALKTAVIVSEKNKQRLDVALSKLGIVSSRSQAESFIKLGKVTVNGQLAMKAGFLVSGDDSIELTVHNQYVSRAGLKLESVVKKLKLNFKDKIVLDVGSSTGGFTDFALRNGAKKVIAVDVGTDQLHKSLRNNLKIELYEKTDIRDVSGPVTRSAPPSRTLSDSVGAAPTRATQNNIILSDIPGIILIDVSFISQREILPHIFDNLADKDTLIVSMIKPQFEAGRNQTNKGVIKNDAIRRQILRDFEDWSKKYFIIVDKRDSDVAGAKGNQERFYLLKPLKKS